MRRKTALIVASILMVLGIFLTGCDSSKSSTTSDVTTVTVGFNSGEFSKEQVDKFNKDHTDIKIKLIDISAAGKLQSLLASGNAPDIIRIYAASQLPSYINKGIAMNLQSYFDKSDAFSTGDFLPAADEFRYDSKTKLQGTGDLYGFVKDWSQDFTLWYNKKIFDQNNIPYPSPTEPMTWDDVYRLGKRMTVVEGGKVKQYGLGFYNSNMQANVDMLTLQAAQQGKSLWSDDFTTANFEDPAVKTLLQQYVDLVKANVGNNTINQDANFAGNTFNENKMAMFISGYWYSGMLRGAKKNPKDLETYGYAPAPVVAGGTRMDPTGAATGGIIFSGTKHVDAAWKVFEYLFGGSPADDRAKSGWGIPGFKSKMELMPQETAWDKEVLGIAKNELDYASPFLKYNPYLELTAVNTIIDKYMVPVYYGRDTLDNAAKQINQALNQAIQSGMQQAGK